MIEKGKVGGFHQPTQRVCNMFRLDGKIAIVIGGAGGLGRACAAGLGKQGATIVVADLNMAAVQKAIAEIQAETGIDAMAMTVDVTREESIEHLASQIVDNYGTVDILVNAQGINFKKPALDVESGDWDAIFEVNGKGVLLASKVMGKIMIEKRSGKIVTLSSVRGARAIRGGNVLYGATKGAVDMITRMLAAEWAPYNINVNAIGPSVVNTEAVRKALPPEKIEEFLASTPFKRFITPEDVAAACVYLASEEANNVTGQILYVDGGAMAVG